MQHCTRSALPDNPAPAVPLGAVPPVNILGPASDHATDLPLSSLNGPDGSPADLLAPDSESDPIGPTAADAAWWLANAPTNAADYAVVGDPDPTDPTDPINADPAIYFFAENLDPAPGRPVPDLSTSDRTDFIGSAAQGEGGGL